MKEWVSLDEQNAIGFGLLVYCCGIHQQVEYHAIESGQWWECVSCKKPLVLVTDSGWYKISEKLLF